MIKILFQGDSITDAGRDRSDYHNLAGYTAFAAEGLKKLFPETELEIINLGISGNRTCDLLDRYEQDFKALNPDILSILVGVNDIWHWFGPLNKYVSPETFEKNYRMLLENIKRDMPNTKIIIMEPFLLPAEDKKIWKMDLNRFIDIIRKLAAEFAEEYIPLDGLFAKEAVNTDWKELSSDGVHPAQKGQLMIAKYYIEAVKNHIKIK